MERRSFFKRSVIPPAVLLAVMASSFLIYNNAWRIENDLLHAAITDIFAVLLFLGVGLGVFFVYPLAFFRGAGLSERVAASLVGPFAWALKEAFRVGAVFSAAEAAYFLLNPLSVGVFFGAAAEMGLCEMLCRRRLKRGGAEVQVVPVPAALALGLGLFMVVFILAWGLGVHSFYIFQAGYEALFGTTG